MFCQKVQLEFGGWYAQHIIKTVFNRLLYDNTFKVLGHCIEPIKPKM